MQRNITKYRDLQEVIHHFQLGVYEVLIIEGKPGTGKSQAIKQVFSHLSENDYCWLEGRTTAPAFYEKLYEYRDCPIVLDDADMFISDKQCLNLLKTLCQTDKDKRVQWLTLRKLPEGMPTSFNTDSRVIIITNQWKSMSKHLAAVQDRGLYVSFMPTTQDIHQYARDINICSIEIWSFFDMFLSHIKDISLRQYVIAHDMHTKNIPWRKSAIASWGLDPLQYLFIEIQIDYPDYSDYERKELFTKISGKNIRVYERIKRELMERT